MFVFIKKCLLLHLIIDKYQKNFKSSSIKKKGIAYIKLNNGNCRQAEVHWYQIEVAGKGNKFYYYQTHVATDRTPPRLPAWIGDEISCEGIR